MSNARDDKILDAIFSGDYSNLAENPDAAAAAKPTPAAKYPPPNEHLLQQLKAIEEEAVQAAETEKDLQKAFDTLSNCFILWPTYASAYNNRAQVLRLLGRNEEAQKDLDLAIEYGDGNPALLKQAYTQRAVVKKALGDLDGSDRDFGMGAKYGNDVAKAMVKENPYAKMCSAIVTEVMAKYQPNASG
ncbi:Tetratricopeptide repeat protein 36 [Chytriomyces hyalinus]|nr:Tetratricopeptide repeat protein 36 [Chytriomyces hyalinus]